MRPSQVPLVRDHLELKLVVYLQPVSVAGHRSGRRLLSLGTDFRWLRVLRPGQHHRLPRGVDCRLRHGRPRPPILDREELVVGRQGVHKHQRRSRSTSAKLARCWYVLYTVYKFCTSGPASLLLITSLVANAGRDQYENRENVGRRRPIVTAGDYLVLLYYIFIYVFSP